MARRIRSTAGRAAVLAMMFETAAHAQDESKRYRTGQIKVGDRVEIPWGAAAIGLPAP